MTLCLCVVCSYALYLVERKYPVDCQTGSGKFSSYTNALWCVLVTISTVGFGDMAAETYIGRCVTIMIAFIGLLLSALLIELVQLNLMQLNSDELKAARVAKDIKMTREYQSAAEQCIEHSMKIIIKKFKRKKYGIEYP